MQINCYFVPVVASSQAAGFTGEKHADFVVGDRDGTTAHPALSALVCLVVKSLGYSLGYSVAYNHPYKGVELVRRYSNPADQRHSVQLKINRQLYMNEETLKILPRFEPLKVHLQLLVGLLLKTDLRQLSTRLILTVNCY